MEIKNRRPWGHYKVLDQGRAENHLLTDHLFVGETEELDYKVKMLTIKEGKRLSLQSHEERDEFWIVIQGAAEVQVGLQLNIYRVGDFIRIPAGAKHRVRSVSGSTLDVKILELQLGTSVDEEDIKRFADDYGRAQEMMIC